MNKPRILVIEDDSAVRNLISTMLSSPTAPMSLFLTWGCPTWTVLK